MVSWRLYFSWVFVCVAWVGWIWEWLGDEFFRVLHGFFKRLMAAWFIGGVLGDGTAWKRQTTGKRMSHHQCPHIRRLWKIPKQIQPRNDLVSRCKIILWIYVMLHPLTPQTPPGRRRSDGVREQLAGERMFICCEEGLSYQVQSISEQTKSGKSMEKWVGSPIVFSFCCGYFWLPRFACNRH